MAYPNTTIELKTDLAVVPRVGMSDGSIELNTDLAVVPRIGISDGSIELNTDLTVAYINIGSSDSSIELNVESDGGESGLIPQKVVITDNTTETIIVGNKNSMYALFIDFVLVKLTSSGTITGKIYITHDGLNTSMDVEYIDQSGGTTGISFDSRLNGNNIEFDVTATSISENLEMIYYVTQTL